MEKPLPCTSQGYTKGVAQKGNIKGRSMGMNSIKHKFYSSAIVGGILPRKYCGVVKINWVKKNKKLKFGFLLAIWTLKQSFSRVL